MDYIRFAALGDSASHGVGDLTPAGHRGWAQLLADAMDVHHHVSLCKVAIPGSTVAQVRHEQLAEAVAHRPIIASLVVGLNDTVRSVWDPAQIRDDLMHCAGALAGQGALVMTPRFHDHSRVLGLPWFLARPMQRRIAELNEIYDEVHEAYGVVHIDLDRDPGIYERDRWAMDRLHPSELGHRCLARHVGLALQAEGIDFLLPSLDCDNPRPKARQGRPHPRRGGHAVAGPAGPRPRPFCDPARPAPHPRPAPRHDP